MGNSFKVVYDALYSRYQSSFVSVQESADELGIHFTTARSWLSKGCYPVPTVSLGSRRVVSLAAIASFVSDKATNDAADSQEPGILVPEHLQQAQVESTVLENKPKRGRGRPPKIAADVKPKRGAPSKVSTAASSMTEVRHG